MVVGVDGALGGVVQSHVMREHSCGPEYAHH